MRGAEKELRMIKKKLTKILRYWFYKSEQINNKCDIIKYDDFDFIQIVLKTILVNRFSLYTFFIQGLFSQH